MERTYRNATGMGIAVLAGKLTDRTSNLGASKVVDDYLADDVEPTLIFAGLVNASWLVLERLEQLTGEDAAVHLQAIAAAVAAEEG